MIVNQVREMIAVSPGGGNHRLGERRKAFSDELLVDTAHRTHHLFDVDIHQTRADVSISPSVADRPTAPILTSVIPIFPDLSN